MIYVGKRTKWKRVFWLEAKQPAGLLYFYES